MHFVGAVTTMPTEGSNAGELSCLCPTGNRLRVNAKKRCYFGWSEKVLCIRILTRHCASYRLTEWVLWHLRCPVTSRT